MQVFIIIMEVMNATNVTIIASQHSYIIYMYLNPEVLRFRKTIILACPFFVDAYIRLTGGLHRKIHFFKTCIPHHLRGCSYNEEAHQWYTYMASIVPTHRYLCV